MQIKMEEQVKKFYNKHSKRFDSTRVSIWKCVRDFVETLPKGSTVLDVGCGNGKNIVYMKKHDIVPYGIDFSSKLVDICRRKSLDVCLGDVRELPFGDNSFDHIISIAVLHHLKYEKDRIKGINEMIRVCKDGGEIFITVWSVEQDENSRRSFTYGDNLVSWEDDVRYYFIYDESHIKLFLEKFNVIELKWEKGNLYFKIKVEK